MYVILYQQKFWPIKILRNLYVQSVIPQNEWHPEELNQIKLALFKSSESDIFWPRLWSVQTIH